MCRIAAILAAASLFACGGDPALAPVDGSTDFDNIGTNADAGPVDVDDAGRSPDAGKDVDAGPYRCTAMFSAHGVCP
jgi:hypothetical protein